LIKSQLLKYLNPSAVHYIFTLLPKTM
jgi:hypothetical protein